MYEMFVSRHSQMCVILSHVSETHIIMY